LDEIKKAQVVDHDFCEILDRDNKFFGELEVCVFVTDKNGLQERICIIAHVGMAGHRRVTATLASIRIKF